MTEINAYVNIGNSISADVESKNINAEIYRATLPVGPSGDTVEIGEGLKLSDGNLSVNDVLSKFKEDEKGNLIYGDERIASVPAGGLTGDVLTKTSDKDFDYNWQKGVTLEYTNGDLTIL